MMEMCLEVGRGYEDIINVDKSKWETGTNLIHEPLEGLSSALQTKGHLQKLEKSKGSDDGRLGDVQRPSELGSNL